LLVYDFEIEGVKIEFIMENGKDGNLLVGVSLFFLLGINLTSHEIL